MSVEDFTSKKLGYFLNPYDDEIISDLDFMLNVYDIDYFNLPIKELPFYKDYLRFFNTEEIIDYIKPLPIFFKEIDKDLLIKLIVGSNSLKYNFELNEFGKLNLIVSIYAGKIGGDKNLAVLYKPQIFPLYKILLKEMIAFDKENLVSNPEIIKLRKNRLNEFYDKKEKAFRKLCFSIFNGAKK